MTTFLAFVAGLVVGVAATIVAAIYLDMAEG